MPRAGARDGLKGDVGRFVWRRSVAIGSRAVVEVARAVSIIIQITLGKALRPAGNFANSLRFGVRAAIGAGKSAGFGPTISPITFGAADQSF
jgi:hypothetical protein